MNLSNNNNTTAAGAVSMCTNTSNYCKEANKGVSKSNDSTLEVIGQFWNMSTADNNVSICANCGKEGDDVNNVCNKCKQVHYCNAACKKKHRHKHKKECEEHVRVAAEQAAELHDKELFKQPPLPLDDCPICFLRMPSLETGSMYMSCCGKMVCTGCMLAPVYNNQGNIVAKKTCPFCRTPRPPTNEEMIKRVMKRAEADDPIATYDLGYYYSEGLHGLQQDFTKALELYHRAADFGCSIAYACVGYAYSSGQGVKVDKKRAKYYNELAAMAGDAAARFNLGLLELTAGNMDRALKHHMIAVGSGDSDSLTIIQDMYTDGDATKEDYTNALQSYQAYVLV